MPNKKSAIQMVKVLERNRARNRPVVRRVRTFIARARAVLGGGDSTAAADAVKAAQAEIDRAAKKGILHHRNAARRKSRLMKRLAASLRS